MKLYLLSQGQKDYYDYFDSILVCAKSKADALKIKTNEHGDWAEPENIKVDLIGTAKRGQKRGIIISSFNAG